VVLSLGALLALIAVEWVQHEPLMPVRYLARPLPIAGAVISWVGAVAFFGLFSILPAFLEQLRGLGARDTGFHLWATVLGAIVGAVVVGVLFLTRWLPVLAVGGLLLLALAAWLLTGLTATTGYGNIAWVAALLGLGAGVSVVPGLFLAALSMPAALVGRALALVTLLRYALQYAVGPALTHAIGTRATIHYADLATEVGAAPGGFDALLGALTRRFAAQGLPATQAHALTVRTIIEDLLRQGQVLGTNDIVGLVLLFTVPGAAAAGAILLALARRRPSPPEPAHADAVACPHSKQAADVFVPAPWGTGISGAMAQGIEAEMPRAAVYLDGMRRRPSATGIQVRAAVLTGSLVARLLQYELQEGIVWSSWAATRRAASPASASDRCCMASCTAGRRPSSSSIRP
jgi:hypothetical protein